MTETKEDYLQEIKKRKRLYKLCLVGDGATGKTTFLRYLSTGRLDVCHQDLRRTPYMDFGSAHIEENTIQIIDLAGQRFDDAHPLDHIPVAALKAADIILFFFSLEVFESFLSIQNWFNEIRGIYRSWNNVMPTCILVGNKNDLTRCVERINGEEYVEKHPEFVKYHEISLLSGDSVEALINTIERLMAERDNIL